MDDDLTVKPKYEDLIAQFGSSKAMEALGVWTAAGSRARKSGYDGVLTEAVLVRVVGDVRVVRRGAAALVSTGFWHAPGHGCEACPQPAKGSWIFHQWFQFRYGTGDAEKVKADKVAELRNATIIEAVWARDTASDGVAHCRYCTKVVRRPSSGKGGDRRSKDIGHLDHVDPTKAIGATNIVVACQDCNQGKAAKTPEQAGMTLLPAPINTQINTQTNTAINADPTAEVSPPGTHTHGGAGGAGVGPGLGRGGAVPIVPSVDRPWTTGGAA